MAKKKQADRAECPNCGATLFQGPFQRGHFEGSKFVVDEEVYQCRNCHTEYPGPDALNIVPLIEAEE